MTWQTLLRKPTLTKLEKNGAKQLPLKGTAKEMDFKPVCKLFVPWSGATWLLTELNPGTPIAFGLCDLGFGTPELGDVDLEELATIRGPGGLKIEQDRYFKADKTLSQYAADARRHGRIGV